MAERADTLGAVLDTTLYRAKMDALHEDMEMLRALETVQATVRRIGSRRGARAAELTP